MSIDRSRMPDPATYFEAVGLLLKGPKASEWKTTSCPFHGGSDSMRIKVETGAWVCMSCGTKGGDVLSFHQQRYGLDFVSACKALGCWDDSGQPQAHFKPTTLSPRDALSVLRREANLVYIAAANLARGIVLNSGDLARLQQAASNIQVVLREYA